MYVSTSTVFVTTAAALCWLLEIMQFYTPCTGASDQEVRSIFSAVSIRCYTYKFSCINNFTMSTKNIKRHELISVPKF